MSKSKTDYVVTAVQWIVGASTSFTVRRALVNNVDPKNKREELELTVGSVAVGMMVGEASETYTRNLISTMRDQFNKNRDVHNITDI